MRPQRRLRRGAFCRGWHTSSRPQAPSSVVRRRILLILAGVAVLAAGGALAVVLVTRSSHTSGELDTALKGVTVSHPKAPRPKPHKVKAAKPKPKPKLVSDEPCWLNFGGAPQRTLARVNIDLGTPTKPLWARGLHGYIEYPPSYCNGTLYVNTYHGRTYAIDARTGNVIWKRNGSGPKPSTPAIAGDPVIVSSTEGPLTAYA